MFKYLGLGSVSLYDDSVHVPFVVKFTASPVGDIVTLKVFTVGTECT